MVQPSAVGSTCAENPVIAPEARSRSTRRFTAGADSPTTRANLGVGRPRVVDESRHDAPVQVVEGHEQTLAGWRARRTAEAKLAWGRTALDQQRGPEPLEVARLSGRGREGSRRPSRRRPVSSRGRRASAPAGCSAVASSGRRRGPCSPEAGRWQLCARRPGTSRSVRSRQRSRRPGPRARPGSARQRCPSGPCPRCSAPAPGRHRRSRAP